MPTLLLTGFKPFHTHPVNPSAEVAEALSGQEVAGARVVSALLPVEPGSAGRVLKTLLDEHQPDGVLLCGLAAGRPQMTVERVALNVMDFVIPDNTGQTYRDHPAQEDGPPAYLSTLPLRAILGAWREAGIPGAVSNTAGLYVCNFVLYRALHHLTETGRAHVPCGFLHVPANAGVALAVPEDRPALPYLPQDEITRAVRVAAGVVATRIERHPPLTATRP